MSGPKSVFDPPAVKPDPAASFKAPPASHPAARSRKPNTLAKRGKFRLAAAAAEAMSDEEVVWWLLEVANGRDPAAPRDPEGNVKPSPDGFVRAPEWKDRLKAFDMYLQRRNGAPAQSVVVEQELHVRGRVDHTTIAPGQVRNWDPVKKAELRALLGQAVRGDLVLPRNVLPAEVEAARDANPTPPEG